MAKTRSTKRKSKAPSKRQKSLLNSTGSFSSNPLASKPSPSPPPPSVSDLLHQASTLLSQNSPHEALTLATHALHLSPTSLPVLELLAEIHIDLGSEDAALASFEAAVSLDPDGSISGPEKFLWLAQLAQGGKSMLSWYERGVEVLRRWIASQRTDDDRALDMKLCSALCAMAEIYMSDLCDEHDAEERCERYVTEALLVVPASPEALQTLASVRVSQQRYGDAVAALQRSYLLWKDLDADAPGIPTYASRINLAKLLIETGEYDTALEVLERLQGEDDQLPDLWYLGGWCLYLFGQQEEKGSRLRGELWGCAREWLRRCERVYKELEWEDEGIREHAGELLREIGGEVEEEEENDDEEEEWESDEGDDDEEGEDDEEMAVD